MEIASVVAAFGAVAFSALAWIESRRSRRQATRASDAAERAALASERSATSDEVSVSIDAERLERERRADMAAGSPQLEIHRCLFNAERKEFLIITRNVGDHSGIVRRVRVDSGQHTVELDQPVPPLTVLSGEHQSMGITSATFLPDEEVTITIDFANAVYKLEWRLTAELFRDGSDRSGWPQWRPRHVDTVRLPRITRDHDA